MAAALRPPSPGGSPGAAPRLSHQHLRASRGRGRATGQRRPGRRGGWRPSPVPSAPTSMSASPRGAPALCRGGVPRADRGGDGLRRRSNGDATHGDAQLLQPAGLFVHGRRQPPSGGPPKFLRRTGTAARRHRPHVRSAAAPGRLLSAALLAEATAPQSSGFCPILHEEVTFGLGFKPTVPAAAWSRSGTASVISARGCGRFRRP